MRPSRIALFALAFGAFTACSPPPATTASTSTNTPSSYTPPEGGADYGPGDYCSETYVLIQPTTKANFSLGSEYFRGGDYCAAYPFLKHLLATEPLYTGEDPDDRTYLRMAAVYEQFAAQVDSTNRAERIAYLDSSLAMRRQGLQAMQAQGIAFDPYLRDLQEGFFYFQNADIYDDATDRQYAAFNRALESKPDSLADWYINQLYVASADEFGTEIPNPERAAYIKRLASVVDDPALKQNYEAYATYIETEPVAADQVAQGGTEVGGEDTVVQALLDDLRSGSLRGSRVFTLLATAQQQPERIEALGGDPEDIVSAITRLPEIENEVDNPRLLYALAVRAYREGDRSRGNSLFDRAIANSSSNAQRADFYYSRGSGRYGSASDFTRALEYFPSHGPSLYRRAGLIGDAVGRQSSVRGRMAYWCLADTYRNVAAASTDSRITSAARRAAAQYERAGPTREQYFLEGFRPGQSVTASLGSYGSCTTRVR